ncbi:MAG: L-glutamine:2-deoxy-scyllo-inosose aminotransferase [Lentisphaerae bacterium ADurb.Bin082]|nr:MAG: L-glutamine:2-deoxy-scyllo-inosose aminotransferase [Lentisphaerae bacterium ADurb.Bin082]
MAKLAINGGKKLIPPGAIKNWPPIDDIDRKMVMASLEGGQHAFGPDCKAFQEEFAAYTGNKFAIFTNSGTAALHMCVVAAGISAGDQVIVTSYSWSSSATCILHHNAIPVFVDINFETMNIDEDKIEAAITPKTKAIIAVNLHGLTCNYDKLRAIAKKHKLVIIEDSCQAHGAKFKGVNAGKLGDCAAFSFNQNKCLCSGEGGMFVTDNEEMAKKAAQLWSFGETATPLESRDYHSYALGWMYRGASLPAAFGRAQLTKMNSYFNTIQENAAVLTDKIKDIKGLIIPVQPEGYLHNWYNYTSRIDMKAIGWTGAPTAMRDAIMGALQAEGAPVGIWQRFILPDMTVFKAKNAYGGGCPWSCPFADKLGEKVNYCREDFPVAQRHCDTHFGMTVPLRAPNTTASAALVGEAFLKVFDNLNELKVKA